VRISLTLAQPVPVKNRLKNNKFKYLYSFFSFFNEKSAAQPQILVLFSRSKAGLRLRKYPNRQENQMLVQGNAIDLCLFVHYFNKKSAYCEWPFSMILVLFHG
jgi:hypothetical protein